MQGFPNIRNTDRILNIIKSDDVLQGSGSTLTITCTAPAGSVVTAYLGNLSVRLKQTETKPSAKDKWMPASFAGQLTLPVCGADEIRAAGEIFVLAKSGKNEASAIGASVRVKGANALIPVRVMKDHTELKLGLSSRDRTPAPQISSRFSHIVSADGL